MLIAAALILGGSIVYAFVPTDAGALMIAAGCALELVKFADRATRRWWVRGQVNREELGSKPSG